MGPLGLDDSDYYISRIAYFKNHGSLIRSEAKIFDIKNNEYEKLTMNCLSSNIFLYHGFISSYFLGKLASFFNVSAEEMYHINYYLGICLISIVLFLILKQFGIYPLNVVIGLVIFSFWGGKGSYHGFSFVLPSFYCILFWLLSIWGFFFYNRWKILSIFTIYFLLFSHIFGIFGITVIFASLIINGLMEKNLRESLKKACYLLILSMIYIGIYKILLTSKYIFPVFVEDSLRQSQLTLLGGFERVFSFNIKGIQFLFERTPFAQYFYGNFSPLTYYSLFLLTKTRQYKLISLFVSTFIGTIILSYLVVFAGYRTFLFLEILILVINAYGIHQSIYYIWSNYKGISFSSRNTFKETIIFLSNGGMVIIGCLMIISIMRATVVSNFKQKFHHQRIFKTKLLDNYVSNNINYEKLIYIGWDLEAGSVLSIDGWWEKKIYVPCMLFNDHTFEYYRKALFIGTNHKYKKGPRSVGLGVFWPTNSKISININGMIPGNYLLKISDSNIKKNDFNRVIMEEKRNGVFKKISKEISEEPMVVKNPIYNIYPKIMPLRYYLYAKRYKWREIRNTSKYVIQFSIENETDYIYLKNEGEDINLIGNIEIIKEKDQEEIFKLDLDYGINRLSNSKIRLLYQKKNFPLIWRDDDYKMKFKGKHGELLPIVLELKENFGDFKVFRFFDEFYNFENFKHYRLHNKKIQY
tara:strand:- start:1713 stop:3797 length:2085 start_codon:yes stop_codon:yes gene_type:complete